MSDTKIEWATKVWNPVTGCSKVSEGCRNCYAEGVANRFWGDRKFTDVQCHEDRLEQPLRWRKPQRVFVNSMSDLFHSDVPNEFIAAVFGVMAAAHQHTFIVLTKRPKRMLQWFAWLEDMAEFTASASREAISDLWRCHVAVSCAKNHGVGRVTGCRVSWPISNVWLGVSVEDQKTADERIPLLLQTPAAVRFVSAEPLLGPVDLIDYLPDVFEGHRDPRGGPWLDWVIVGGESGPKARPMHPEWARSLRDQCVAAEVPFFFKQWGEWSASRPANFCRISKRRYSHESVGLLPDGTLYGATDPPERFFAATSLYRVGRKAAGRSLDGTTWNQFPGVRP